MVSLARYIRNVRRTGIKYWFRQAYYLGDAKSGTLMGKDVFGNKYFENMVATEEVPGRHRWVDYVQDDFNASQVPPEWHSWLHHIRTLPPTEDPIYELSTPKWIAPPREVLTGTKGAYKPYSTTGPKIAAWEPKVKERSG